MLKDLPARALSAARKLAGFLKRVVPSGDWKPVRKIVAVGLAGAVVYVAHAVGLDLGVEHVNRLVDLIVVAVVGYLVPEKS